jgi:hypothetical protein
LSNVGKRRGALRGPCVQYNFMPFLHERACRGEPETVR